MKTIVKAAAFILFAAMLFSLAACTASHGSEPADPTQEAVVPNTDEPVTEAPTEEPTAEPTEDGFDQEGEDEDPIPIPTKDPDFHEKIVQRDRRVKDALEAVGETPLSDCAVKVMSVVPNSPNGPFYEYTTENGEKVINSAPFVFSVDGSKIYINDSYMTPDHYSMFVYDMTDGSTSRIETEWDTTIAMIVADGIMYRPDSARDVKTGETVTFDSPLFEDDGHLKDLFMTGYGGSIRLFLYGYESNISGVHPNTLYTLDGTDHTWSEGETIDWDNGIFSAGQISGILPNGNYCFILHFLDEEQITCSERRIVLTDSDGNLLAYTDMPYTMDEISASDYAENLIATPDGQIYYMACLKDEVAVWRIDLN